MGSRVLTNKRLPVHEVPSIREQVNGSVRNLFHSTPPSERDPFQRSRQIIRLGKSFHAFRASDGAGRDDIGRHASRAKFESDVIGQGVYAGFGDADMSLEGHPCVVKGGGDEDDAAAGACRRGDFAVGLVLACRSDEMG